MEFWRSSAITVIEFAAGLICLPHHNTVRVARSGREKPTALQSVSCFMPLKKEEQARRAKGAIALPGWYVQILQRADINSRQGPQSRVDVGIYEI